MKKRDKTRSAIAASLACAILFTSTFAWRAISQLALNESIVDASEYGGRLHDDFQGVDKKVYIENYTDADSELSIPVFARIRLDEYMEIGEGAGTLEILEDTTEQTASLDKEDVSESDEVAQIQEERVRSSEMLILRGDAPKEDVETPDINDKSTWDTYLFKGDDAYINPFNLDEEVTIRSYRELELGGSTIYMPTFNKDNMSLDGDVNGTMEGKDGLRFEGTQYDDFTLYRDKDEVTADAYYYYEEGMEVPEEADIYLDENRYAIEETHTATSTRKSTIISMEDWVDLHEDDQVGDMWVYDTDGWAYWASPIMPDESTGLLLNQILELNTPETSYYYAIHVTAQIATAGDWGREHYGTGIYAEDSITPEAEGLLDFISKAQIVRVSIVDHDQNMLTRMDGQVPIGDSVEYDALVTGTKHTEVEWSVRELEHSSGESSGVSMMNILSDDGTFTATAAMTGYSYELTATSIYREDEQDNFVVSVYDPADVDIDINVDGNNGSNGDVEVEQGTSSDVTGDVSGLDQDDLEWEVSGSQVPGNGSTGNGSTGNESTGSGSTGSGSTGSGSTGNESTGNESTGNESTGNESTGNGSTGNGSTGNGSTGNESTGNESTGNGSTGNESTGSGSTGSGSTGNESTGNESTGNESTGNESTGNESTGNESTGSGSTGSGSTGNGSTGTQASVLDENYEIFINNGIISDDIKTQITEDGILTISPFEPVGTRLTITATSKFNKDIKESIEIIVKTGVVGIIGTNKTIEFDGNDYYVLGLKLIDRRPSALIYAADTISIDDNNTMKFNQGTTEDGELTKEKDSMWETSTIRSTLYNWLGEQEYLQENAVKIKVETGSYTDINGITRSVRPMENTEESVFLLSYDEFEKYIGRNSAMSMASEKYWLRTPNTNEEVWGVSKDGSTYEALDSTQTIGIRPALWINM